MDRHVFSIRRRCGGCAFAYPLWSCGAASKLAVTCVALSAFSQMYFHAHHLLDVIIGGLIALLTAIAMDGHIGACAASVWHPLTALTVVILTFLITDSYTGRSKDREERGSEALLRSV